MPEVIPPGYEILRTPAKLAIVGPDIRTENLDARWIDGRRWLLLADFSFASKRLERIVTVKAGEETDFASIPKILQNILSPTGPYGKAAVLHDHAYRTPGFCSRPDADALFLEAMEALGVNWFTRHLVYAGVRVGGWASYKGGM